LVVEKEFLGGGFSFVKGFNYKTKQVLTRKKNLSKKSFKKKKKN
jgi:hypothetical protein